MPSTYPTDDILAKNVTYWI